MKRLTILSFSLLFIGGINAQEIDSRLLEQYSEAEIYEMEENDPEALAIFVYALDHAIYYLDVPVDKEVSFSSIRIANDKLNFVDLGLEIKDQNQYFLVEGKNVIFIDDVLYTGRSIRAGMDAINSFGRPKLIELLVLIDRRFSRELPIEPNYVGKTVDAIDSEKVVVEWDDTVNNGQVSLIRE